MTTKQQMIAMIEEANALVQQVIAGTAAADAQDKIEALSDKIEALSDLL